MPPPGDRSLFYPPAERFLLLGGLCAGRERHGGIEQCQIGTHTDVLCRMTQRILNVEAKARDGKVPHGVDTQYMRRFVRSLPHRNKKRKK